MTVHQRALVAISVLVGLGVTAHLVADENAQAKAQVANRPSRAVLVGQAGECRVWLLSEHRPAAVYVSNCHIATR